DEGGMRAITVVAGLTGVCGKAVQPGRYSVNEWAYKVTMMSTRVQTWEFKGGYKKRYIDLSLDQAGNLTQSPRSEDIKKPDNAADPTVARLSKAGSYRSNCACSRKSPRTMPHLSSPLSAPW